jgi:hypothetical protein
MQKGGQAPSQRVDDPMCHVLRAGAELEHRQNLGARIDGQPQEDVPASGCVAWFAVRPTARAGDGGF